MTAILSDGSQQDANYDCINHQVEYFHAAIDVNILYIKAVDL